MRPGVCRYPWSLTMSTIKSPRVPLAVVRRAAAAASLVMTLAVAIRGAEPSWTAVRSTNFLLIGDAGEPALHDVAARLEQFRAVFSRLLPRTTLSTGVPTVVVVFGSRRAFEPFMPIYNGVPSQVGGFFQAGSDTNYVVLTLASYDQGFRTIAHEYTHLLVSNALSSVPPWFNEGVAEFYATFALRDDHKGAYIGRVHPHHVLLLRNRFVPLSDVLAVDHNSPLYNEADRRSVFYAESWALMHYLILERPGGVEAVGKYLAALAGGEAVDSAFRRAFGTEVSALEKELRAYVQRQSYRSVEYSFGDKVDIDRGAAGRRLSAAESEAWLGDLLVHSPWPRDARARLERAVAADPDLARAHQSLGMLALREKVPGAFAHLARAAALDPDNFLTQYGYGLALLRDRPSDSGPARADTLEIARLAMKKASALDPSSTDALAWLGYADLATNAHLDEAREALTRAVSLAPGRHDYQLRLAEVCIRQEDDAEARRLLTLIARAPDGCDTDVRAQALMRRIDGRRARPPVRSDGTRAVLRRTHDGERRAFGYLERIDCRPGAVTVRVKTADRLLQFTARALTDIEFLNHREEALDSVGCGPRGPGDGVFVTWRTAVDGGPASDIDGEVVAVEFVPKEFAPK